jgi:hypothetical protein
MMRFGGANRPHDGALSRFVGTAAHGDRDKASLPPHAKAIVEARSHFPTTVVNPEDSPRLLVSGHNSAKVGADVRKGPWRGMPIYVLTLEERATCPRSCAVWHACMGNAMPLARRHRYTPRLLPLLDAELYDKASQHPEGFAVRLHALGDFPDRDYLHAWIRWLMALPQLHVWGYTAHRPDTRIGRSIMRANRRWPERWAVRFSVDASEARGPMQATTSWKINGALQAVDGIVCPAQEHKTATCGTCGLCWAQAAANKRIVFIGHGMNGGRKADHVPVGPMARHVTDIVSELTNGEKTMLKYLPHDGSAKQVSGSGMSALIREFWTRFPDFNMIEVVPNPNGLRELARLTRVGRAALGLLLQERT